MLDWAVHVRSYPGAPRGGDAGVVIPSPDGALAVLIDGAGHGLSAYNIAQKARSAIYENPDKEPDALLTLLNDVLKGTPGAAISAARLRHNELSFCGIGNVKGSVGLRSLEVKEGVVGVRMRRPRLIKLELPSNAWFLMHTDGVSAPISVPPGMAATVARQLVESHGSAHDDAAVLALRWRSPVP